MTTTLETPDCHEGDIGFQIFIDTDVDCSGATSLKIDYQKPDGSAGTWPATAMVKDGQDGVYYVTAEGDLDQAGVWLLQVDIAELGGFTGSGRITTMLVGRALPGDGA